MIKYAGIEHPFQTGAYSVEKNAKVLQRYRYLHEGLMRVQAGQLPARENWDLKIAFCKHLHEHAEAAEMLRQRIPQLRTSSAILTREPDATLTLLMDEMLHAENDLELAEAIYGFMVPAMLDTYRKHRQTTQQIVDQPTIRILRAIIHDLNDQLAWGREMLKELHGLGIYPTPEPYLANLANILAAAGGIEGMDDKTTKLPERWRSVKAYVLPLQSARDPRRMGPTTKARTGVANPPQDPVGRRITEMARVRQEEMTASELVAGVLFAQKNMPWEFYRELARHIWDEARHALFGQAVLETEGYDWASRPQYTSDYDILAPKIPAVQYAWLSIGIEEGAMVNGAKKKEYEFCRDEARHPLMERFQDYDWADEVVHANFGRRWSPELIGEELGFVREVARKELTEFMSIITEAKEEWLKAQA